MKTYIIKANNGRDDIKLNIADLVPICHKRSYSVAQLTAFYNYQEYEPDWTTAMQEDYERLYQMHNNIKVVFFKDLNTNLIVVPGDYLYPTILTEQNIMDMDNYKQIELNDDKKNSTMKHIFFQTIDAMEISCALQLIISKKEGNGFVISVLPLNEQCGDDAKKLIMPFKISGTSEELDDGFFERITKPLQAASGLMDNMEGFMKQLEEAQKQSVMEKEKADKERKEKEARDKKYKEAMAKADELEKEGKYRDAWVKVPEMADYPDKAEEIRKRRKELSDKFAAPSLFGTEQEQIV